MVCGHAVTMLRSLNFIQAKVKGIDKLTLANIKMIRSDYFIFDNSPQQISFMTDFLSEAEIKG